MDVLVQSYDSASAYPNNLAFHRSRRNVLQTYAQLLQKKKGDLFSDCNPAIDFWQCDYHGQVFYRRTINGTNGLYAHFRIGSNDPRLHDPKSQFIFIQAPHSRENLDVSMEMFTAVLSYRQVMPAFLDFVFAFGSQEEKADFHFSGFRHESRICPADRGLQVPELGRSGRHFQLCYSLRSVESLKGAKVPWSIRQTALYHSFDVESGQACWIFVKGNDVMRKRIEMETLAGPDLRSFQNAQQSFSSSLATHLLFCEWSTENWRWYINFLEAKVQEITARSLDKAIEVPEVDYEAPSDTEATPNPPLKKSETFVGTLARALTFDRTRSRRETGNMPAVTVPPPTPSGRPAPPVLPPGLAPQNEAPSQSVGFQFNEVRRIQLIEERANEALLVLKTNANVQEELKLYYNSLASAADFPYDMKQLCDKELTQFEHSISNSQNYFRMQQSRLETLLRILADRKTLLYGILDYQNVQFSKRMSEKGQHTAASMERMTKEMNEIAIRTKQETVSMKIITLVTLFFLPGTFISTLMSTDIIQYENVPAGKNGEMFSMPALRLFLAISVPLMVFTFLAWAGIYYWVKWREQKRTRPRDVEAGVTLHAGEEKQKAASESDMRSHRSPSVFTGSKSNETMQQLSGNTWKASSWFTRIMLP